MPILNLNENEPLTFIVADRKVNQKKETGDGRSPVTRLLFLYIILRIPRTAWLMRILFSINAKRT